LSFILSAEKSSYSKGFLLVLHKLCGGRKK